VPIGQPFDAMRALIVDEQLREVEPGREGELLMAGPQLSLGYWQDGERTRGAFVFRCKGCYPDWKESPRWAWPVTESGDDGIEVFLETDSLDTKALVNQLKGKLPTHMLPRNVVLLRRFPLNANGKYDRKALQLILENTFGLDRSRITMSHSVDRKV
jgi:acyl-coenzyme A synthetase/AMP-(fatty) acid ligase